MATKQSSSIGRSGTLRQATRLADALYGGGDPDSPLDLGASNDAPPAYGEFHDQIHLSQAGFNAGATVTEDGRVNITISQTNRQLADLLAPALRGQLLPSEKRPSSGPLPPAYIPPNLGGQPGQTPPPKLNVVIQIVGSRGDVQPFVALGIVLKQVYGHRVRMATHPTFQKFVEENGLEFFSIGGDPAELMAFMVKNPGLMPGIDALKSGEVAKRRRGIEEIILGCWRSCIEAGDGLGPAPEPHQSNEPLNLSNADFQLPGNSENQPFVADAIIANPPSFAHIHIAEKMGIPLHIMFTMPWSPTKAFSHPLANIQSSNMEIALTNYVSYALVEMMTWQGLGDVINRFRTKVLDLDPMSLIWAPGILTRLHIPTTYCWSPALIPKPNDWGSEVSIPGFFFLDLATSYTPEPDLATFLDSGPPPVYIGFGSIVVDDPNKLTRMIFDAVSAAGVRALVSKGWGGLGADSVGIPEGVFMLGNCPHDWLFQKVACVVHHGGAGTTAAGIKTGTPTVVVPFFGDQPFWGAMIAKAGAGPAPIPYKKLTAEGLAEAITTALRPETRARAKELGEKIRQEKGSDLGAKAFHDFLDYDKLRCSIAPSRAAAWQVKKTQFRLSALAAAVLVKEGLIQYSDLSLYRAQDYDTEEQPWDPISAVTSALVGDVGSLAMAVGDISREWYKVSKKSKIPTNDTASASTPDPSVSSSQLSLPTSSGTTNLPPTAADSVSNASAVPSATSGSRPPVSPTGQQSASSGKGKNKFDLDAVLGASVGTATGARNIVETGFRSPMNFCMGLAKGFRNVPKLYNDDTVRKQEKVTGIGSGLKVAGKEFGLGLFDGVTGLVTQPLKGAEKDGMSGLIKGFGKGIGGVMVKPVAGFWAIPAYTMKGVHEEWRAKFHKSVQNYILCSRILQGQGDLRSASVQEKDDIIARFRSMKDVQANISAARSKAKKKTEASVGEDMDDEYLGELPDEEPKTGFFQTRHLSIEERKKLHAVKKAWRKKHLGEGTVAGSTSTGFQSIPASVSFDTSTNPPVPSSISFDPSLTTPSVLDPENEDMERAIRESVAQTSTGDREEDARIEAQIRASVQEMRRVAAANRQQQHEMRDWKGNPAQQPAPPPVEASSSLSREPIPDWRYLNKGEKEMGGGNPNDISDEEYEALIAKAVRQSMIAQQPQQYLQGRFDEDEEQHGIQMLDNTSGTHIQEQEEDDEDLRRAMQESLQMSSSATSQLPQEGTAADDEHDEELKRAIEESERAHREHVARTSSERTEEEIVMEYVKKQSLAEEQHRQRAAKGKSATTRQDEEGDQDLQRALRESLRMSGKQGKPSSSSAQ